MTEIAMVASGSRGDVQPYIALGKGLKDAGYNVRMLTNDNFESLVTNAGLMFCSIGESVEERLKRDDWKKTLEGSNFLQILSKMQQEMKNETSKFVQRVPPLLEGSDLILTGMAGMTGIFSIADKLNIRVIQAHVFPFTPTSEFPSPLVPKLPFGGTLNKLSFHATRQVFWQSFKVSDAITRKMLGLGKPSFWGPYRSIQEMPILYGYSNHVLPRPSDWAANQHVTGYWFLDAHTDWIPPSDLVKFLDAGEPPVYIGFGSMGGRNPEKSGQIALEALALSGQRGVIASGWGGLKLTSLPDNVHLISSIPHSWLFEKMAAVVHHGGAGTTAAGLRAGVPSIIVPFMGDQPFWGKRVADLGVGTAPISQKKMTARSLADAITQAVSDTEMRRKAAELGRKMQSEGGIANAVTLIERYVKTPALA